MNAAAAVEGLLGARPSLAPGVRASTREVRGERWVFLHNAVSGRHLRVTPEIWELARGCDGRSTVTERLVALDLQHVDEATRAALASGLAALLQAGILGGDLPGAGDALWLERTRGERHRRRTRWTNPLSIRCALHDPDAWLSRLTPVLAPVFGRTSAMLLACIGVAAIVGAGTHAAEIGGELARLAATPSSWWRFLPAYLALKCCHELAHALALRHFGGRVHELGVTLLVLVPVPYVDASDSWRLPRRRERALVGAAGVLAELVIAAMATLLWLAAEPGVVRELAFATAVSGSVTTLLFNANPLLRFDGYHVLQDLIDMPNLATRATRYWLWLARRRLFRVASESPPVIARGECRWLLGYGALACLYRWFIGLAIALWLASEVPVLGVALASFSLWSLALRPASNAFRWLRRAPQLEGRRWRSFAVAGGLVGSVIIVAACVPLPASTRIEGVLDVPGGGRLVAPEAAVVVAVHARPGERVSAGAPLLELVSLELDTRIESLAAAIDDLEARRGAALIGDATEARLLARELERRRATALELERRRLGLLLRAPADGLFMPPDTLSLLGRALERGEPVGFLVEPGRLRVRAAIEESRLGRLRERTLDTRVRLAERAGESLPATLLRMTPAADRRLPSAALAGDGGGDGIRVAASDGALETLSPVFQLEVGLAPEVRAIGIGGRAYLTFRHPPETLAHRGGLAFRALFLERLAL